MAGVEAEHEVAAPVEQGHQHAQAVVRQRVAAVIGFAAPDREHHGCGYAEARFDAGDHVGVVDLLKMKQQL